MHLYSLLDLNGFSTRNIDKYLKLNDYKHNGINLFELYLNLNNAKTKEDIDVQPTNTTTSNIKIVDNGKSTESVYSSLKAYCH